MQALPEAFLKRMQTELAPEDYQAFVESYSARPEKGLRANTLKTTPQDMAAALPEDFHARPVPWCPSGCYIDADARPGKQPGYYTGLYYPQEPSAMSSAQALGARPGEFVLDLCAAPGGKSTQIAADMAGAGTLVCNEIVKSRVGILASNVERMGIGNAVILNEFPENLVKNFAGRFDKILVDAPCSGEGMFRKDESVRAEWTPGRPAACAARQIKILESVDKLLKPGGELVYSTCTFAPEENEQIVEALVASGRYTVLEPNLTGIATRGEPAYTKTGLEAVTDTVRIWPQVSAGEGHYVARLKKIGAGPEPARPKANKKRPPALKKATKSELKIFEEFRKAFMPDFVPQRLYRYEDRLYRLPEHISQEDLAGLKVKEPGLLIGTFKKNRFEPAHALAMALSAGQVKNAYDMTEDELWAYLKGETVSPKTPVAPGWVLMTHQNHPVGFGKMSGVIKNKYPKGLRIYKK